MNKDLEIFDDDTFDIDEALDSLEKYISSYRSQKYYREFSILTFINDIIYGLGISINPNYTWAEGYDRFKRHLILYFIRCLSKIKKIKMEEQNGS